MSKCSKVKNPCKICLGPVTHKNGLQCHGACESWVHYACLNYTPGKIKDIKAGIIKVTCPCPDCKTVAPKEFRTDLPFSCNNTQCPANMPPKCESAKCPTNANEPKTPRPPSCPLGTCGTDCKTFSTPLAPELNQPPRQQACNPPQQESYNTGYQPNYRPEMISYNAYPDMSRSSDGCLDKNRCHSGCATPSPIYGEGMYQPMGQSRMGASNSGSMPSFHAVQQMCNTVGQLTSQLNELMLKMKAKEKGPCDNRNVSVFNEAHQVPIHQYQEQRHRSGKACQQKGPKSLCPKPCYCPGNPGNK